MMTTQQALMEGLVTKAPPEGGEIRIAVKLRGDGIQAPGTIVLVQYPDKWLVWFHNRQDGGGYHGGYYGDNYAQGVEDFCTNVLRHGAHLAEI
ncbi:hypothetical protein [Mesorhizobium sp.]|uniref:hypothetical protein n=1 Tax=Mesorhizobium sp. TaxID=1871066 RepID=UPI000FE7B475|nr:hypothetical protein [Mesorhizobium sp.]RWD43916.1 MAG: hypothetical protein EOS35_18740 [Mesorhizobium sp.]TIU10394.1 MAG: hypothetical protein E5W39_00615 [Mesorhizobium sp.]